MHLVYIDDSFEHPVLTFSAIAVPATQWRDTFETLQAWRQDLKRRDGILIHREFHATEFVAGRGRLGPRIVSKHRRSQIFHSAFKVLNGMDQIRIFNICFDRNQHWAFERLLTRINRTMITYDSHALLICDEGKEADYTRLVRKLSVFNPIANRHFGWGGQDQGFHNAATRRILEDPFFKKSDRSYFVQMADFCAYGLLRREKANANKNRYGIHRCFDELSDVVERRCNPRDPMGVIRP